jgi:hypothetical protein
MTPMRKRTKMVIFLACALAAAATTLLRVRISSKEPKYNRRPLHYWVALLPFPSTDIKRQGRVYRQLDTNALPYLVEWIQYEPPQWRHSLARSIKDLPPRALFTALADHVQFDQREVLAEGAVLAFDFLGANAAPAIPDLARLMDNPAMPRTASRATCALGAIGTNSMPALLKVFENPKHPCQLEARTALIRINLNLQPTGDGFRRVDPAF